MRKETKATLEILIHKLQEILENALRCTSTYNFANEINELLNSWIKANKLHPENIQITKTQTTTNYDGATKYYTFTFSNDDSTTWLSYNNNRNSNA